MKSKKAKKSSKSGFGADDIAGGKVANMSKSKNVAEELRLFQNSNLLNQQDPMELLQKQLNQLIQDDSNAIARFGPAVHHDGSDAVMRQGGEDGFVNQVCLSVPATRACPDGTSTTDYNISSSMFTIKKGVLWQHQNYDKFHQKLFNRWKKRFFILTTDYLVCFKRSTTKVGRSEMGKFLYKTSLGDILELEWSRPNRSDKGAIILRMNKNQSNLFLWTKDNLDEWMMLIESMRLKRRLRASHPEENHQIPTLVSSPSNQNGIYENAVLASICDGDNGNLSASRTDRIVDRESHQANLTHRLKDDDEKEGAEEANVVAVTETDSHQSGKTLDQSLMIEHGANKNGNQRRRTNDPCASNNVTSNIDDNALGTDIGARQRPHANMINDDGDATAAAADVTVEGASVLDRSSTKEGGVRQKSEQDLSLVDHHQASRQGKAKRIVRNLSDHSSSSSPGSRRKKRSLNDTDDQGTNGSNLIKDSNDNLIRASLNQDTSRNAQNKYPNNRLEFDVNEAGERVTGAISEFAADNAELRVRGSDQPALKLHESKLQNRPISSVIRRDDSWHSSLSLNRIANNSMQAVQRSHHPYGDTSNNENDLQYNRVNMRHFQHNPNFSNIEATVTPLRDRAHFRQQSMHCDRRLPQNLRQQQASSFDAAQMPSSSQLHNNQSQEQPTTSYHQKLLQLQLMHQSNYGDLVRRNGELASAQRASNEYQIYGPGSIATTNHYGYYSMRSNLKSAASEFSFIRPNSSEFQATRQPLAQPIANMPVAVDLSHPERSGSYTNQHNRIMNYDNLAQGTDKPQQADINQCLNIDHLQQESVTECAPPNRDLPLKPNKKRQQQTGSGGAQLQKNTTLGSSIVHFFRRAFSKRSKRKSPKFAESCSSSIGGALDDKFESIQRTRSAFSTTEGARKERLETNVEQQSLIDQRHRMIDLIEAFSDKTNIEDQVVAANRRVVQQNRADPSHRLSALQPLSPQYNHQQEISGLTGRSAHNYAHQMIGSPLHKSNSVSTSTGLSGLNEMMRMNEVQQIMLNNQNSPSLGPRNVGQILSPMVARQLPDSHLSPFNGGGAKLTPYEIPGKCYPSPARNSANLGQMPRPSSIYGQPSMISSPITGAPRELRGSDFGSHRSSIHSYHHKPDSRGLANDLRRHHQTIKAPFLDTTREVAEEVSSPTIESKPFAQVESFQDSCATNELISRNFRPTRNQRHAIVNPILQSPTMSLIYDNHPMPSRNNEMVYSHYDNYRPIEYQQSASSMDLSTHSNPRSFNASHGLEDIQRRLDEENNVTSIVSPVVADRSAKLRQSFNVNRQADASVTPSHRMRMSQQLDDPSRFKSYSLADQATRNNPIHSKPAAMIAPTTPMSQRTQESNCTQRVALDSNLYSRARGEPMGVIVKPSPISVLNTYHQQSPFVARQTRVITRSDGVQATMIQPETMNITSQQEAVVNIVGAPGINLEPSLAHSLLRGTNINAFESTASGGGATGLNSYGQNFNTKTFLVSSRLSKAIPDNILSSADINRNQSAASDRSRLERVKSIDDNHSSRSTSSTTDGTSSSASSSAKSSNLTSSRRRKNDANIMKTVKDDKTDRDESYSRSSNNSRRRGSSTEQSDELSSRADSFEGASPEDPSRAQAV